MPCVTLKNGVRLYISDDGYRDKDFMEVVLSDNPQTPPEKEEQSKELKNFIRDLRNN